MPLPGGMDVLRNTFSHVVMEQTGIHKNGMEALIYSSVAAGTFISPPNLVTTYTGVGSQHKAEVI